MSKKKVETYFYECGCLEANGVWIYCAAHADGNVPEFLTIISRTELLKLAAQEFIERFMPDENYEQSEASHSHCYNDQEGHQRHLACCLCGLKREAPWKFQLGQKVKKISGSMWHGKVVGFYSTELTPRGYAVESDSEKGSVQIYPEKALIEDNE